MRRLLVIGVAIAMVTVFFPVTQATHFSGGAETAIGNAADESSDNPSVVGEVKGDSSTPYGVGTNTTSCYEATAQVDGQAVDAATTDGFCGQLVYNADSDTYRQVSPPDQDYISAEIGTFDVQRSWRTPVGLASTCLPMCNDSGDEIPETGEPMPAAPQNQTWNAVHDTGALLGLTDTGEDAHEQEEADCEDNCRFSGYGFDINHADPANVAQRNAGIWEMNGWIIPPAAYGGGFIGFLYDTNGDVITDDDLEEIVGDLKDKGDLPSDAVPKVCGFTPDRNFQGNFDQGFCESELFFVNATQGDTTFDGYDNACNSPSYVCGPTSGAHWDAQAVGLVGAYGSRYQGEHMRWHWMVAPNEPDCVSMEPGASLLDNDGDPYLAHDLDVYTPPQRTSAAGSPVYTDNLYSIDDGDDGYVTKFTTDRPNLPIPNEVDETLQPVRKGEVLEPNHVDTAGDGFDDDSRIDLSLERSLGAGCSEITATESPATVDDWVNILDSGVTDRGLTVRDAVVEDNAAPTRGGFSTDAYGLYGTDDASQDEDNDPTTDLYSTDGRVGIFTDKNDDGDYDNVIGPNDAASGFGQGVYQGDRIQTAGAYPMLWDMWVELDENDEPVIAEGSGCNGPGSNAFADLMEQEGYGMNTGLAQAIYLKEPTVFTDGSVLDPQVFPYGAGNNIYVLGNQAVRTLWDGDIDHDNGTALDAEVDDLVEGLRDFVVAEHGANAGTLSVHVPGEDLEMDEDYDSQCNESTGGFSLDLSFTHSCETDCSGDTIATMYTFEVNSTGDGHIGGGDIASFTVDGEKHNFGAGTQHTWVDIDPFDGDADRNEQRIQAPPSG